MAVMDLRRIAAGSIISSKEAPDRLLNVDKVRHEHISTNVRNRKI
jgi:hypothetical protein